MPWLWGAVIFFAFFYYLSYGYSKNILMIYSFTLVFLLVLHWTVYLQSKREVIISKKEKVVTIYETTFFRKITSTSFPLHTFIGIRSYLHSSEGAGNIHVELVHSDGIRGLPLSNFAISYGDKFLSYGLHENKEAEALRKAVSEFANLKDLGFLGSKWKIFPRIN